MTLPLIYTLNVVDQKAKKKIIKNVKKNNKNPKIVKEIIDLVHEKVVSTIPHKKCWNTKKVFRDIK